MNNIKIKDFFDTDYVDAASYDNLRKIASYIDGLKNSSRKIIYTLIDKNIAKVSKVSRIQSTISEHTEYLHGEDNISSVIVNLAQNFTGSNNLPLMTRNGNFGNRFEPIAAASRYIYTMKENYLNDLFVNYDNNILIEQEFEGVKIEPRYFVPIIPILLCNGSEGISSGFAQKILPRDPQIVISELIKVLKGTKKIKNIKLGNPYWNGFNGSITVDEENSNKWYISGSINILNKNNIEITELPIGYTLKKYISVLESLYDDKIIMSYKDLSENDEFKFKIKVSTDFTTSNDIAAIYKIFKLVRPISENYTCINEYNRIEVFENVEEIFIKYFALRLKYYDTRKKYIISKLSYDISVLKSRYYFIKSIIAGTIVVNNKSKDAIIKQIEKNNKIIKIEDNYDYLLRMPIYSLSKEKLDEINKTIKLNESKLREIKSTTIEQLWLEDLSNLKSKI